MSFIYIFNATSFFILDITTTEEVIWLSIDNRNARHQTMYIANIVENFGSNKVILREIIVKVRKRGNRSLIQIFDLKFEIDFWLLLLHMRKFTIFRNKVASFFTFFDR